MHGAWEAYTRASSNSYIIGNEELLSVIAAAGIDVLIRRSLSTGTKLTRLKTIVKIIVVRQWMMHVMMMSEYIDVGIK